MADSNTQNTKTKSEKQTAPSYTTFSKPKAWALNWDGAALHEPQPKSSSSNSNGDNEKQQAR